MPFEMIVQDAFTERLPNNGVRVRQAGEHITDLDQIAALSGNLHVVRMWVDDPEPESTPAPGAAKANIPAPKATAATVPDPALAPSKL